MYALTTTEFTFLRSYYNTSNNDNKTYAAANGLSLTGGLGWPGNFTGDIRHPRYAGVSLCWDDIGT